MTVKRQGAGSTGREASDLAAAVAAAERRIGELERLVDALRARVEHLEKGRGRVRSGWDEPEGPQHEPSGG